MMRIAMVLPLLVLGCGPVMEINTLPVAVTMSNRPGWVAPPAVGAETRSVRSYYDGDEVAGANCTLASAYWQAQVITPALVTMPDYGAGSPDITAQCRLGAHQGSSLVRSEDQSEDEDRGGLTVGTDGEGIGAAVRLIFPTKRPPAAMYDYPNISVTLR